MPDIKTIEKPMFFQHFWMHPLGVGWGGGGCTYGGLAYLPCFRRFVSPYIRPRPLSSGRDQQRGEAGLSYHVATGEGQ